MIRETLFGAAIVLILWALFEQWRRNKDTMNTVLGTLVIGAAIVILLSMIWQKATTGRVHWPISL